MRMPTATFTLTEEDIEFLNDLVEAQENKVSKSHIIRALINSKRKEAEYMASNTEEDEELFGIPNNLDNNGMDSNN